MARHVARLALVALLALCPAVAAAQEQSGRGDAARQERPAEARRLPQAATTRHSFAAPEGAFDYTVTVQPMPIEEEGGKLLAEVVVTAYQRADQDAAARPVTFAFNGGPGAASAYLHFGALGPKWLDYGGPGGAPSDAPRLVDNPDSWLPFTDLVFIDPPGTGWSRFAQEGDELRRRFWSVDGDIELLARVVTKWLTQNGRLASPKYLAGESYGGFRAPKLAASLQTGNGVGMRGVVMVSPVLDFGSRQEGPLSFMPDVARLPSFAATRLERAGQPVTAEALAEAERYAATDYLVDLLRGPGDAAAQQRMAERIAALTGFDAAEVRRREGRLGMMRFASELRQAQGLFASPYDTAATSPDPTPAADRATAEDPVLDASRAPLTSAAIDYYGRELNWRPETPYRLLNGEVARRWRYPEGQTPAESVSDLRSALALDKRLKALVVHGATDVVTPYFASKLVLRQLPAWVGEDRARLEVYPGGHMFYSRVQSRQRFSAAVRALIESTAR